MKRIFFILLFILFFPVVVFAQEAVGPMDSLLAWMMGQDWWYIVSGVVTIATGITMFLPSVVKEWKYWNVVMLVINKLAGGVGHGKLADDKTKITVQ